MAKVLVVDSEPTVSRLVRSILEEEGHQVVEASTCQLGYSLYVDETPDLLITHIGRSHFSGYHLIESVRRYFPSAKILVMTGLGAAAVENAKKRGADRGLGKSFKPPEFLQVVKELLQDG